VTNKPSPPAFPSKSSAPDKSKERYMQGDPIPVPDAVEANTESSWALFDDVPRPPEPEFLDTLPASLLDEKLVAPIRKQTE
jgi:hypothetical protein